MEHAPARASDLNPDSNFVAVIDRLAKAKAKNYDAEQIIEVRNWLHGYKCKFGRDKNPHAPTDDEVAKFLSIAEWPRLQDFLYGLMAERKEAGEKYAWFWTVAIQRLHHISPDEQRRIRSELRLVGKPKPAPPEQQEFEAVEDLRESIRAAAAGKGMR